MCVRVYVSARVRVCVRVCTHVYDTLQRISTNNTYWLCRWWIVWVFHLSGGEKSGGELAGGELVVNCLVATCPTPKANQLPWPREWMLGECVTDAPSSVWNDVSISTAVGGTHVGGSGNSFFCFCLHIWTYWQLWSVFLSVKAVPRWTETQFPVCLLSVGGWSFLLEPLEQWVLGFSPVLHVDSVVCPWHWAHGSRLPLDLQKIIGSNHD